MTVEPENTPNAERQPRTCNRHFDCDKAEQEVMTRTGKQKWEIHPEVCMGTGIQYHKPSEVSR